MNCFQGHFLVAAPHQLDPDFAETVILVVEQSDQGAFGVIVNSPRDHSSRMRLEHRDRRVSTAAWLNFGGPFTGPLMAIHTNASLAGQDIVPGLFYSDEEETVLTLVRQGERPLLVFFGYAGWEAGELESEVERGLWRVVPATSEQVFSQDRDLWQQLSRQAARLQLRTMFNMKHIPTDPLLN